MHLPSILNSALPQRGNRLSYLLIVAVLIFGMTIYARGFVELLPYHLNADEPNIYRYVLYLMENGRLLDSYPPVRLFELAGEFILLDLVTPGNASQVARFVTGRYFTILYGVLLLAVTYQAGRQLHSAPAGLAAAIFMIAQPNAYRMAKIFKVDNFAWLLGMAAILLCFYAVRQQKRRWLWAALAAVALSTIAKYTMAPLFILPGLLFILMYPRTHPERFVIYLIAGIIVVAGLYIALNPPPVIDVYLQRYGASWLEDWGGGWFPSLVTSWPVLADQVGIANLYGAIVGLPFVLLVWPREKLSRREQLVLFGLVALIVLTVLLFGLFAKVRSRDRYTAVLGFALLWGMVLASLLQRRPWLVTLAAVGLSMPGILQAWEFSHSILRPDTRVATAEWFVRHVPEGTHIAIEYDHVEFNPFYGGYPEGKVFVLRQITSVHEKPLEQLAREGIEYVVADYRNINRGGYFDESRTREREAFASQTELMLDLNHPHRLQMQGPARLIYRIPSIQQHPMHVFLGDRLLIFKGYDLSRQEWVAGETLDLVLYWAGFGSTDANLTVFAHLIGPEGSLAAQQDDLPGDPLHRTYDWELGYFDWDEWPISLPADLPAGRYELRVGMYDSETLMRLPATDPSGAPLGDSILLTTIVIEK